MWQFKVFSPKSKQAKHQKVIIKSVPRAIKQNAGMQKQPGVLLGYFKAQNFNISLSTTALPLWGDVGFCICMKTSATTSQ
jgi:hypothetical protein